mgnify:CR=1 FL=1
MVELFDLNCASCGRGLEGIVPDLEIERVKHGIKVVVCSTECGLDLLWKWKENQPKLSKSKLEDHDTA